MAHTAHDTYTATPDDLYAMLGVQRDASDDDIRRAFRKAARTEHPDKGGDEQKFAAINRAYEILKNPEQRAAYDAGGLDALYNIGQNGMSKMSGGFFEELFGMFGMSTRQDPAVELVHKRVTIEQLCRSETVIIEHLVQRVCQCAARGKRIQCVQCKGVGHIVRQIGPMMRVHVQCATCDGRGCQYKSCAECSAGLVRRRERIEIRLRPSMYDANGYRHVVRQCGSETFDGRRSDVWCVITVEQHHNFAIKGAGELHTRVKCTLRQALLGFEGCVDHPAGHTIAVQCPATIQHGQQLRIPAQGISDIYDMIVTFEVHLPEKLTVQQRMAIETVF
jgi:DnaJ-class molecular chaperone